MDIVRYYLFVEGVKMKFKQILRFDVVEITSEISAGNVELYATSIAANTTVKIMGTYLAD